MIGFRVMRNIQQKSMQQLTMLLKFPRSSQEIQHRVFADPVIQLFSLREQFKCILV